MARYCALIEYDGTNFFGFQRQSAEFVSIQSEIERVISILTRDTVVITGAGRTDSGVHASGQVISFTIEWRHGVSALKRALNASLPKEIAILHIREVPQSFHPRFDARRRAYQYFVYNKPERSPLRRRHSWHVPKPLHINLMNEASELLLGTHDFATFGLPPKGVNTVRELFEAHWQSWNGFLLFSVEANAFLYRMVRSLVGSLVAVGLQNWQVAEFDAAFRACDRSRSAPPAPPQGLYLTRITYED